MPRSLLFQKVWPHWKLRNRVISRRRWGWVKRVLLLNKIIVNVNCNRKIKLEFERALVFDFQIGHVGHVHVPTITLFLVPGAPLLQTSTHSMKSRSKCSVLYQKASFQAQFDVCPRAPCHSVYTLSALRLILLRGNERLSCLSSPLHKNRVGQGLCLLKVVSLAQVGDQNLALGRCSLFDE